MLDLLAEYFRDLIAKSIEIIEFNEAILSKDKFKGLTLEETYKQMTIQDMLLDDQIDADLIVDKLQHVKVKYLSPNVNNWEVNKLKKQSCETYKTQLSSSY